MTAAINSVQYDLWHDRVVSDREFTMFHQVHTNISVADIWRWPSSSFDLRTAFFIAKLIVTVPDTEVKDCNLCHCSFLDVMMHSSCEMLQINIFFELIIELFPYTGKNYFT